MKKTLLIATLSIPVLLLGGLGYFWHRTSQTPQSFYASGKKYYDQKKYQEAAIQLMNAVRKDPRHRDAKLLLARTLVATRNLSGAVIQLKGLLEYYPDDADGSIELGNLYLEGGRADPVFFHQAQELAQKVLAKNPNNVDALVLSGTASAWLKDLDKSVATLEKATSLDPQNSKALLNLGAIQVVNKNLAGAEQSLIKAHETNPKDTRAALTLADYYVVSKNSEKAEAAFKDALAMNPADRDTYLQVAQFYFEAKRFDDGEKVLQGAQAKSPDNPAPSLALANAYQMENRPGDVRKLLVDLKTKFPKDVTVATKLAQNLLSDQPDRAMPEIDQIIKTQPNDPFGYVLLGEAQFRRGKLAEAEATLSKEPALSSPYPEVHFLLGNLALQKGQVNEAVGHFEKSAAIKNYVPARMVLAELYLNTGKLADSRQQIEQALAVDPANAAARLFKTSVEIAAKNYNDAGQELLLMEKEHPDSAAVQRQLGFYYQTTGKNAEAERSLTRALELAPNSEQNFEALAGFYLRNKQPDKVNQIVNRIPDANKHAFHYELLGMAESAAGKPEDSVKEYLKALVKDPKRSSASQLLLNEYVRENKLDDAKKMVDDVIQRNPSNSAALAIRGNVYLQQGKKDDAMKDFEKALQIDPNQDIAANNEAYLLAEQGRDLENALKYAQTVRRRHGEDPSAADTLGWVYYKMGRLTLAIDELKFAASKQPENPLIQYHLGATYRANNQRSEAEMALKKALASKDFQEKSQAEALLQNIEFWRHIPSSPAPAKSK